MLYELKRLKFPAHKWRLLANSLRVASVVDNIDANHRDVAGKLQAVISHWVKSTTQHNQWITLVEAIDMCFEHGVAEQLATAVGVEYTHSGEHEHGLHICSICVVILTACGLHNCYTPLELVGSHFFSILLLNPLPLCITLLLIQEANYT